MKLKIKKIVPETVMIWHDDYGFIGEANEYEFDLLRVDIKENQLEGYYVLKNNTQYHIDRRGVLVDWDFFELKEECLEKLMSWE